MSVLLQMLKAQTLLQLVLLTALYLPHFITISEHTHLFLFFGVVDLRETVLPRHLFSVAVLMWRVQAHTAREEAWDSSSCPSCAGLRDVHEIVIYMKTESLEPGTFKGIIRCKFNQCFITPWHRIGPPPPRDKVCRPLANVVLASSTTAWQQYTAVNGSKFKPPPKSHK